MDLAEIARRLELEDLYAAYAACLDSDALEAWPDFFTDDCHYRVTSAENYETGLPLGLIYASSKDMLRDRISALRQANIYEPQRYRHLISGIRPRPHPNPPPQAGEGTRKHPPPQAGKGGVGVDPESLAVEANFLVIRTMQDGAMIVFAAGRYVDRMVRGDAGWRFASKIVVLDSRHIDTLLAIPL
ncbi:MAG TPA: aromatic-ring-hydroxylating dioxygenase subunit beta [Stellaceae bacterium]|nr:aromatic-ring-hydroxylating dioxygenase subunit beta [Stellaceae bacterium]